MQGKEIFKAVQQIHNIMRKHGAKNVLSKLQQLDTYDCSKTEAEQIDCIVSEVAKYYQVTAPSIFATKERGKCSEARKMCWVLICQLVMVSEIQIAWYFNRHNSVIYKAIKEFKNMDRTHKRDRAFLNIKDILEPIVRKQLESITPIN